MSKELIYNRPKVEMNTKDINEWLNKLDANFKYLSELDKTAPAKTSPLYGFFMEPVADGQVPYQVIDIKGNQAKIKLCEGICGDDYVHPYFGYEKWIDLQYAKDKVNGRRAMEKLFSKKS